MIDCWKAPDSEPTKLFIYKSTTSTLLVNTGFFLPKLKPFNALLVSLTRDKAGRPNGFGHQSLVFISISYGGQTFLFQSTKRKGAIWALQQRLTARKHGLSLKSLVFLYSFVRQPLLCTFERKSVSRRPDNVPLCPTRTSGKAATPLRLSPGLPGFLHVN